MVGRSSNGAGLIGHAANRIARNDPHELSAVIARALPQDGVRELLPGVSLARASAPSETMHGCWEPSLCVIAQGSKEVLLGSELFRYDPARYLIATMELPTSYRVVDASSESPYLSLKLKLDPAIVSSVIMEARRDPPSGAVKAMNVSELDAKLLDGVLRL